jgi:hypothetical protein
MGDHLLLCPARVPTQGGQRCARAGAVAYARGRGARAIEGYPMLTEPGGEITWDELSVGARSTFLRAGFTEIAHPTPRRFVMRVELQP